VTLDGCDDRDDFIIVSFNCALNIPPDCLY